MPHEPYHLSEFDYAIDPSAFSNIGLFDNNVAPGASPIFTLGGAANDWEDFEMGMGSVGGFANVPKIRGNGMVTLSDGTTVPSRAAALAKTMFGTGDEGQTDIPRGGVIDDAVRINTGMGPVLQEGADYNPNLIKFGDYATNEVMENIGGGTLRPGYRDYTPEVTSWIAKGGGGPIPEQPDAWRPPPPSTPGPASVPVNGGGGPPAPTPGGGPPTPTVNRGVPNPSGEGIDLEGGGIGPMLYANAGQTQGGPVSLYQQGLDPAAAYRQWRGEQFPGETGMGMMGGALGYGYRPAAGRYALSGSPEMVGNFAQYLRNPAESLATIRSNYGKAADWLRSMGTEDYSSEAPTQAYGLMRENWGEAGAPQTEVDQNAFINASLAAMGVRPGAGAAMAGSLGNIYSNMQDRYGAQGAGRFADYIQSSYL